MRVLMVEPGKEAVETEIENSLEAMQAAVGGYIEMIRPYADEVALICNEEGKLEQLPLNRVLYDEETGQPLDVIAGTFFICGAPANSSEFASLSDEQLQKYQQKFQSPELILPDDEGIMVIRGMGGM